MKFREFLLKTESNGNYQDAVRHECVVNFGIPEAEAVLLIQKHAPAIMHDEQSGVPPRDSAFQIHRRWLAGGLTAEMSDAEAHEKPGGSNVGKERETSGAHEGPFCGPAGGAPAGSYPITNKKQVGAAKSYAHNAPNPSGIKACAERIAKKRGW
jgi:hypothetical protein